MLLILQCEVQGCQRCGTLSRRLVLPVLSSALPAASAAVEPAQRAMKRTYSSLWTGEDLAEDYGGQHCWRAKGPQSWRAPLRKSHALRSSDACLLL